MKEIGCCGAYCRTCKALKEGSCKGCKLGYDKGERDLSKARCRMKICCFKERGLETCADCKDMDTCDIIQPWFEKGYKYWCYKAHLEFIRENGYDRFLRQADKWKDARGNL